METIQLLNITPQELQANIVKELTEIIKKEIANVSTQPVETVLTPKQFCERYSITLATLNNWQNRGVIKGYRLGGKVFYKLSETDKQLTEIK